MKIAHYIGDHAGDTLLVRTSWALTRLVQRGDWRNVTHCEAILGSAAANQWCINGVIRSVATAPRLMTVAEMTSEIAK